jgi:hypothetical protein
MILRHQHLAALPHPEHQGQQEDQAGSNKVMLTS